MGLTRGSGRAHLARATLEAIAYQTVDAVRAMEAGAGEPLRELRADGGATANRWLMQFQADVLGVPVVLPEVTRDDGARRGLPGGRGRGPVDRERRARGLARAGALRAAHGRGRARLLLAGWEMRWAWSRRAGGEVGRGDARRGRRVSARGAARVTLPAPRGRSLGRWSNEQTGARSRSGESRSR